MSDTDEEKDRTAGFAEVLQAEWAEIDAGRGALTSPPGAKPREAGLPPPNLVGLALSGGGIRSATFNLGVIQALAELRLLRKFDYLSTVSGGGYIGSWLSSWMASHDPKQPEPKSIVEIEQALAPEKEGVPVVAAGDEEPHALRYLRSYTDYLKPRGGIFSLDAVTAFTTWLRNSILNQLILVAVFAVLLLVPLGLGWIIGNRLQWAADAKFTDSSYWWYGVCVCLAIAVGFINANLIFQPPAAGVATPGCTHLPWYSRMPWVLVLIVLPLVLGCFSLSITLPWLHNEIASFAHPEGSSSFAAFIRETACEFLLYPAAMTQSSDPGVAAKVARMLWLVFAACAVAFLAGFAFLAGKEADRRASSIWIYGTVFFFATLLGLLLLPAVAEFLAAPSTGEFGPLAVLARTLTFGPPLILSVFALAVFAYVGLVGRVFDEHQREWWSRLVALIVAAAVGWLALFGISYWGPLIVEYLEIGLKSAIAWLAASGIGAALGHGSSTAKRGDAQGKSNWLDMAAEVAPYIFVPGLCLLVAYLLNQSVLAILPGVDPCGKAVQCADAYVTRLAELNRILGQPAGDRITLLLIGLIAVCGCFSWRVDINVFSFHNFYRNRLTRAYLGAGIASADRDQDKLPLTGMNDRDSPRLANLPSRPYHLLNTALNITSDKHLSWQERKAASFFFSKKYCGYLLSGQPDDNYCRTEDYVSKPLVGKAWLSLGVPMTISGAAASPNSGYHTSPALAFLMTVFNLRLGWWMQNTASVAYWRSPGPRFGLKYLFRELVAKVDEDSRFVYLSDGGHFENLGIYELARRNCRFILACDAGADPGYDFEDLGNAIRKCYIDLGVRIDIDVSLIRPQKEGPDKGRSKEQWAVGYVYYPGQTEPGILLYVKSSMGSAEATDIEHYKAAHQDFPHDPTANQFFTESQFESYRKLGYGLCRRALNKLEFTKKDLARQESDHAAVPLTSRQKSLLGIVDDCFGSDLKVRDKDWTSFAGKVRAS